MCFSFEISIGTFIFSWSICLYLLTKKLKKYQREVSRDLEIDRILLEDKQMRLPGLKGKWVAALMNHKSEIDNLWELYNKALVNATVKVIKDSPIQLAKRVAEDKARESELIVKIRKEIKDQELIVEYLEKMEKVFSSMSYDISNVISLIKLETN